MSDETKTPDQNQPPEPEFENPGESPESTAAAVAEAEKNAAAFFIEDGAPTETATETTPVAVESTAEPAPESKTEPAGPKVGAGWQEAARRLRFSDEEIAAFKDDQEAEFRVQNRRVENLREAGVDISEFVAFRQWRQQQTGPAPAIPPATAPTPTAPTVPTPTTPAPTALEDFKLDINDEDFAPEMVTALRGFEKYANQLKATLGAENAQLRQDMTTLQGSIQQRAENTTAAQDEAKWAVEWDAAAKATPGFVDEYGMPSEIKRLPPDDPRVLHLMTFTPYFGKVWPQHARALGGDQNVNLQRVVAEAFDKAPRRNKETTPKAQTNGQSTPGPGSVVRSSPRIASPEAKGDTLEDVMAESREAAEAAFKAAGGRNPFAE